MSEPGAPQNPVSGAGEQEALAHEIAWFNVVTPFDPALEGSASTIEILIFWGDTVICAQHLTPPRSFYIGEVESDYIMPAEALGVSRAPLVLARWDGLVNLVVFPAATGTIEMGGTRVPLQDAARTAPAKPSAALKGAAELPLMPGAVAWIDLGGFSFRVSAVRAGLPFERARYLPRQAWAAQGISAGVHFLLLGVLAALQPLPPEPFEISADQMYELQKRLAEIDEKEAEREEERGLLIEHGNRRSAAKEPEYWLAALSLPSTSAVPENTSRLAGWVDSRDFSMIGLMYEPSAGQSAGSSTASSREAGGASPRLTAARPETRTTGRDTISPEVIQRIIRQSFGRFRICYENGLRMNPNLQGRVTVRFIIGVDGQVSNVSNGGSDLPDGRVVQCVVNAFHGLTFPSLGKGVATVVYPILFSPGG